MRKYAYLLMFLVLLSSANSELERIDQGIQGQVVMADGETPHHALVIQVVQKGVAMQTVLTDQDGYFNFSGLQAGKYLIRFHLLNSYLYYHQVKSTVSQAKDATIINIQATQRGGHDLGQLILPRFKRGRWKTYEAIDGLADAYVNCIYKDSEGQMWFGTEGGLSYLAGDQFQTLTVHDGLPNNWITCLLSITKHNILVGTTSGLAIYDSITNQVKQIDDPTVNQKNIGCMLNATSEGLLIASERKVFSYRNGVLEIFLDLSENIQNQNVIIRSMAEEQDGTIWIGTAHKSENFMNNYRRQPVNTGGGLFSYRDRILTFEQPFENAPIDQVTDLLVEGKTKWACTNIGLLKLAPHNTNLLNQKNGLLYSFPMDIFRALDGSIWLSSQIRSGITRINNLGCVSHFNKNDNPNLVSARDIFFTENEKVWVATWGRGLLSYDLHSLVSYNKLDGFGEGTVVDTRNISADKILVAFGSFFPYRANTESGLYIINLETEIVEEINERGNPLNSSIHLNRDGKPFILLDSGLYSFQENQLFPIYQQTDRQGSVCSNKNGDIWFKELDSTKLFKLANQKANLVLESEKLAGYSLLTADSGDLWLGNMWGQDADQPVILKVNQGKIQTFSVRGNEVSSLRIRTATTLSNGSTWFGTWRVGEHVGGISIHEDNKFSAITTKDGLGQDIVFSIAEDQAGRLWIGTWGAGVSIYDGESWSSIDTSDGLDSNYVKVAKVSTNNQILIGTYSGFFIYTPSNAKPKVIIRSARISQESLPFPDYSLPVTTGKRITFNCRSMDYKTQPHKIKYRYRVLGKKGKTWSQSSIVSSFDFVAQEAGTYTFQVQSVDRDLNYSDIASLEIDVSKPWFLNLWVMVPSLGLVLVSVSFAIVFGVKYFHQRLESQQLRDQMLAELTQELEEARQMQTALLPELAPNVSHLQIAGRNIGAKEVGGDFFDYLMEGDNQLSVAVGDVSGKGLKGAMNAVMASGVLRLATNENPTSDSSVIMGKINKSLYQSTEQDMNVTMVFAQFDLEKQQMTLANAGQHAYPLLKRGQTVMPIQAKGLALGMMPAIQYKSMTVDLQSGDLLLFMTDGITEPRNEEGLMYEESGRFHQMIASLSDQLMAEEVVDRIIEDVLSYMVDEEERDDDITLVAVKVL